MEDVPLMLPPTLGGSTLTVTVCVSWAEQLVALVANTLNVVVAVKFPVGRLIVVPVPDTTAPTLVVPVLKR